jgi:WS/DGAT/MGAT family acyltransferase
MSKYQRLSGTDAMFVYMDSPRAYQHTLKIAILDPSSDPQGWSWERFQQHVRNTIHKVPLWRQRCMKTPLALNYPVWVDDPEFDLDYHVRRIGCPAPGGKKEFSQLVSDLYSRMLDPDRPLWQMWVIEGLEDGAVGVVTLLHHAYTDGVGVLSVLDNIMPEAQELPVEGAPAPWKPAPLPSAVRRLLWGLKDLPGLLARNFPPFVRGALAGRRIKRRLAAEGVELPPSHKDPSIPKAFSYRLDSSQRQFSCRSFQLADIRRAAKSFDRTINDVFTSCVAGALRRYLAETGQMVDRPTLASMPMNAVPLEQRNAMGNFATVERLGLRIDIEDPLERLQATAEACEVTKQHFRNTRDADLRALFNLLHPAVMKFVDWLNEKRGGGVFPISNVTLSNVPGPRKERYVQGWKVKEWYSTGQVGHGVALNMTVWSYAQQFNLCVLSDRSMPADNALLLDYFGESLNELLDLARQETTEILIAPDVYLRRNPEHEKVNSTRQPLPHNGVQPGTDTCGYPADIRLAS